MARNAAMMSVATMTSRVTGFVRDLVFTAVVGDNMASSAYAIAIVVPNKLRQVFAEGAMSAAFVPMLAEAAKLAPDRLWTYVRRFMWALLGVVVLVVILASVFSPAITALLAPEWRTAKTSQPVEGLGAPVFELTVRLMRMIFPYLIFICLSALVGAVLNYHGYFGVPAIAPAIFNTVLIVVALGASWRFGIHPLYGFAFGWVVAGIAQVGVQVPLSLRIGMSYRPALGLRDPLVVTSGLLLLPRLGAYGVGMVNELVAQRAATGAAIEDGIPYPIYLYLAIRLTEFVLGGFVTSVATVILPTMSRQHVGDKREAYRATVSGSLRAVAFITIPSAVALATVGVPIVRALFERGNWSDDGAVNTAYVLSMYCTGLFAFGAVRVVVPAFFAQKDTRTPVVTSLVAVGVNVVAIQLLVGPLRAGGIALALSIAQYANLVLLMVLLRRRLGRLDGRVLADSLARIVVASGVMAIALHLGVGAVPQPAGQLWRVVHLFGIVATGTVVFLLAAWILRVRELRDGLQVIRPRLERMLRRAGAGR